MRAVVRSIMMLADKLGHSLARQFPGKSGSFIDLPNNIGCARQIQHYRAST
jgi:hypothetical protein